MVRLWVLRMAFLSERQSVPQKERSLAHWWAVPLAHLSVRLLDRQRAERLALLLWEHALAQPKDLLLVQKLGLPWDFRCKHCSGPGMS